MSEEDTTSAGDDEAALLQVDSLVGTSADCTCCDNTGGDRRFKAGDRVSVHIPHRDNQQCQGFLPGRVVDVNVTDPSWPSTISAPYRVWLHSGTHIIVNRDTDDHIIAREQPADDAPASPIAVHNYGILDAPVGEDEPALTAFRFEVGDRVSCRMSAHPVLGWEPGRVVAHNYRESDWPIGLTAPYQICLHSGGLIYAREDTDEFIVGRNADVNAPSPEPVFSDSDDEGEKGENDGGNDESVDNDNDDADDDDDDDRLEMKHYKLVRGVTGESLELSRFLDSCRHNFVDHLQELIDDGFPVDSCGWHGSTGLITAAEKGNYNCVKLLIDKKANVNHQNRLGATALHAACRRDNLFICQLLINSGADPDIKTHSTASAPGQTAFEEYGMDFDEDYIDAEEKAQKVRGLKSLRVAYIARIREENWQRRKSFRLLLAFCQFQPLEYRRAELAAVAATLAIPPPILPEDNTAVVRVFCNEGLTRHITELM